MFPGKFLSYEYQMIYPFPSAIRLLAAALAAAGLFLSTAAHAADRRPNIVLLLSDDGGYADFARHGADMEIPMPQFERMMDQGVRFTDAYVSAPICVPSRASLHTGRHNQRFGLYTNDDVYNGFVQKQFSDCPTLAERLGQVGYKTGLVGKWHLPFTKSMTSEHGFEEFHGLAPREGMDKFMPGTKLCDATGKKVGANTEYLTDHWGKTACDFIERHKAEPFFLTVCFNAVHTPMEALEEDMVPADKVLKNDPNRRTYTGMMTSMDRNIGRILDQLDALGLSGNTLVVFANDNGSIGVFGKGGVGSNNYGQNTPLRDGKFSLHEGGIRTPFVLRWPGRLPKGEVRDGIVSTIDLGATFLAAAEVEAPAGELDGSDILPYASGTEKESPRRNHIWQATVGKDGQAYQVAVRQGPWKLYLGDTPDKPGPDAKWELFNLDEDIGETIDLGASPRNGSRTGWHLHRMARRHG